MDEYYDKFKPGDLFVFTTDVIEHKFSRLVSYWMSQPVELACDSIAMFLYTDACWCDTEAYVFLANGHIIMLRDDEIPDYINSGLLKQVGA